MAVNRHREAAAPVRSSGPVSTWFARHADTARASFVRLVRQPLSSGLTILVIGVTLALPASLNLVVKNAAALSGGWDSALDFSVFLELDVGEQEAAALGSLIGQRADVESVTFVPADEALAEFRERSGLSAAIDQLADNPLPHALIVRPGPANTARSMGLLREELDNLPETAYVQVDTEWVQRFHAILDIVRQAIVVGSALIGAAIVVIIGNTIRLDIQNRRDEIEVTKLIGASNAFVRRPFLWTGFWYGLSGGVLAIGLVVGGIALLEAPVSRLAGLYSSGAEVLAFDLREIGIIVGAGVGLGLVGSWFAAARHMRAIEPR